MVTQFYKVLFTLINIARWCNLNPEEGLAGTNKRFLDRFSYIEASLGEELKGYSQNELEKLWKEAKSNISKKAKNP